MEAAENNLKTKQEKMVWLWVLASNERAVKFYEKQNYQWIGNASFQMEENNYDNKVMTKKL